MKDTNKNVSGKKQKLYTAFVSLGICALVAVTAIYGVQMRRNTELAEQDYQYGDNNPVTGPVAKTAVEENDTEAHTETKEEDTAVPPKEEKAVETMAYNGKDKFAWPVSGNVIIPYSMDTTVYFETLDQYQCNPALYIKAEKGTEVKAALRGTVSSVTNSDRYGNQITLDMGNGYKMCYGQLSDIPYQKGDVVEQGSVLGKIAEPTNYFALEGSHLYMKMTQNGKPINPTDYLEP